ncbi:DUF3540 domain-containing protein [Caballeronia sp. LZ034LL]|uniref:DUF3540 domain-containing protein n=1 Tax=Caballeronia sp. LZ034LL TaxID=3038567 RepID=UPI002855E609|nr:DUF3540 domain-containing protein [Caballeronia sp. LZ034LL]MDR5836405.1 DUF3540 domain-containing protein [Caballeronia sp. LZ034LL]
MSNPANLLTQQHIEAQWPRIGRVQQLDDDGATVGVALDGEVIACQPAFSCLLAPACGDTVLVTRERTHGHFVIAIIERPGDAPATLRMARPMIVEAEGGLRLSSARDIELDAVQRCAIHADHMTLDSARAELHTQTLSLRATVAQASAQTWRSVTRSLETLADHIVQVCKQSFRTCETVDHVRAAQIDHESTELMRLHSRNVLLSAEHLSKIDGEQIHLG